MEVPENPVQSREWRPKNLRVGESKQFKCMKTKLIFAVVFLLLAQIVNSQTFGLRGGVNFANMNFSASGLDYSPKSIFGVHFGPVADFQLDESLYFNTGLLYSLKGFKVSVLGESIQNRLNCLEIPLDIAYKFSLKGDSKFFIQAGPYLGYALSGKTKYNGETEDIEFEDGGMKRFDLGLGFGAGLEFGAMVASLNYQMGLANMSDDSEVTAKNKVLQISVAYMFGAAK